jgi:hypothetical protein
VLLLNFKRYGIFFFPILIHFFFFELNGLRTFCSVLTDFFNLLWFRKWTEPKAQDRQQKLNPKIWTFLYHILKQFFLQNDHLYGLLMDHYENLLLYFKNGSNRGPNYGISYIWKVCLTLEIVNQDKCSKLKHITVSNTFCVQQFTVSSKILCPYILLIYTCSTFPSHHAMVVLCLALSTLTFDIHLFNFP